MKHEHVLVRIEEWLADDAGRAPADALRHIWNCLRARGMRSLEQELSDLLRDFIGRPADQFTIQERLGKDDASMWDLSGMFVTCLRMESVFLFVDLDRFGGRGRIEYVEFDLFAPDEHAIREARDLLVEETMKCFGLTKSKESLVKSTRFQPGFAKSLRDQLTGDPPIDDALFHRLQEERDRAMLRELKKRGAILERDLGELVPTGTTSEAAKRVLDYLSGEEYRLVDRKYAIVCRETREIVLPLRQKADFNKAAGLECPKCGKPLGDEEVMAYYAATDSLRGLIDGNKWMPLLVRDAFVKAGVPEDDIYTEVKYGEDEIDVLVFYRRRILAVEAKNRPVSLNDAYKLSAKRTKLDRIASGHGREFPTPAGNHFDQVRGAIDTLSYGLSDDDFRSCIPVVISTNDIAKDARDLLNDSADDAAFLEHSDGRIEAFIRSLIDTIDEEELTRRLRGLTAEGNSDSVANLAAEQVRAAFRSWLDEDESADRR